MISLNEIVVDDFVRSAFRVLILLVDPLQLGCDIFEGAIVHRLRSLGEADLGILADFQTLLPGAVIRILDFLARHLHFCLCLNELFFETDLGCRLLRGFEVLHCTHVDRDKPF